MASQGRPTDYKPEYDERALILCEGGATDIELADEFGIHVSTLYRWRNEHSSFREAVRAGKDACDDRVERSFYNRAVGYTHEAVKIFMPAGAGSPVYACYREHVPPDPGAALNWLKNRRPDKWRDKVDHDINVKGDLANIIAERRAKVAGGNEA